MSDLIQVGRVLLQKQDRDPTVDEPNPFPTYVGETHQLSVSIRGTPWKTWTGYIASKSRGILIKSKDSKTVKEVVADLEHKARKLTEDLLDLLRDA